MMLTNGIRLSVFLLAFSPCAAKQIPKESKAIDPNDGGADPSTLITIPLDAQLLQKSKGYGDSTDDSGDGNLITIPLDAQLLQKSVQPPPVKAVIANYQKKLNAEEQLLAKDEHMIAAEKQLLAKSDEQAAYWKSLETKEATEMHEMMKAEEYTAEHQMDKSSSGARLIACLKTRDIAQMEGEKLQKENAQLEGQVREAAHTKDMINQTLSLKISEIAAKATQAEADQQAKFDKLQKEQSEILTQFAKVKEDNAKIMEVKRLIEGEREQMRKQLEDITKKHDKVKEENAKIVKAHEGLKKAHEVLQKRHDELETRSQTANATQLTLELHVLQEKHDNCLKNITSLSTQEKKIHETEADLRLAAFKQGARESDQKWGAEVKNATSQRDASRYAAQEADKQLAALRATAEKETKGKEEAEVKLRQCRASREKMEIELERITKKSGEKSSFLQLAPSEKDWADDSYWR